MMNLVYIKRVDEYDDILKKEHRRIPMFLKKIIYMYKNMFDIITKKKIENENIWVLPVKDKYSINKLKIITTKLSKFNNTYLISDNLLYKELKKLLDKNNIPYIQEYTLKKYLVIKILEYICMIQNKELKNIGVSILVEDISEFNIYLIEKLARIVKNIKVVSSNIYKFKNLEEKLYNEYGIGMQFSNSYKKSLAKSRYIINLDYTQIDINEYEIFNNAIIINCARENIKIKSKLFNGIVINSCSIKFKKEIIDKFRKINIYQKYNTLALYTSYIINNNNLDEIFKNLDIDKVRIINLIGNNGNINKNEFKNIFKKLDK